MTESAQDKLQRRIEDKRDRLVELREDLDRMQRHYNEALAGFQEEEAEFRDLLGAWRVLLGAADANDEGLWPEGFFEFAIDKQGPSYLRAGSNLDAAYSELSNAGDGPLHVDEIIRRVNQRTGRDITKTSLVSSMARLAKEGRGFARTGPNTFRRLTAAEEEANLEREMAKAEASEKGGST